VTVFTLSMKRTPPNTGIPANIASIRAQRVKKLESSGHLLPKARSRLIFDAKLAPSNLANR